MGDASESGLASRDSMITKGPSLRTSGLTQLCVREPHISPFACHLLTNYAFLFPPLPVAAAS